MIKVKKELIKKLYDIYKDYYINTDSNKVSDAIFEKFMEDSRKAECDIYNELKVQTTRFKVTDDLPYTLHKLVMMTCLSFEDCIKLYKLLGIKVI